MRKRAIAFGVICALCLLVGGGWVVIAALSDETSTSDAKVGVAGGERLDLRGRLLVRAVDKADTRLNGHATSVTVGADPGKARAGDLACERIYEAAGRGICLYQAASGVDYRMKVFDKRYRTIHEQSLQGLPSRARVSPSGRWGATTTFVSGHAYASPGTFSTQTQIVDMHTGKPVVNVESFGVEKDGKAIDAPDFNFWGVTFAHDDDTIYATLSTGGKRYLVKGSMRKRRFVVVRENMECPSLSPDETRIAYKKRVGGVSDWHLHVYDLKTGRDVALPEQRSIDDQVEWLDDDVVLYGDGRNVWATRADGGGRPERVLARADSPASLEKG
jgi:hypothetical protein